MTYELAKKLKDAGFPYPFGWDESVIIHTLATLIEACGEEFGSLRRFRQTREDRTEEVIWLCSAIINPVNTRFESFSLGKMNGYTPEEAVANLWLALNHHETLP